MELRKIWFLDYLYLNKYYYSDNPKKPFQFTEFTKAEFELTNILENFSIWQKTKTYLFLILGIERMIKGRKHMKKGLDGNNVKSTNGV